MSVHVRRIGRLAALGLLVVWSQGRADNCSSYGDCYDTARAALSALAGLGVFAALVSFGLDLMPVVGTLKGLIEAATGRDLVTHEPLARWQRVLGIIPIGGAILSATPLMRIGPKMMRAFRVLDKADFASLARTARALEHIKPLERTGSEIGAAVKASKKLPELQKMMGKVQARPMAKLTRAVQNHRIGDVFEIRVAARELMPGGRGIRSLQDRLPGIRGRARLKGADIITTNGDVLQFKNYGGVNWDSNLRRSIKTQAEKDFKRYARNGWQDGAGGELSKNFEFQFNARRLLREGRSMDEINTFAADLTDTLRKLWARHGVTHTVIPSF